MNCLTKIAPCPAGTKMNTASGLASRARCRNGAKSGLASGTRMNSGMVPPPLRKASLKEVSESMPGAKSDTMLTTFLRPFLSAHCAMITLDCGSVKLVRTI